jgi:DNA-binding response OmpR family regulator
VEGNTICLRLKETFSSVDDDAGVRAVLAGILQDSGYVVDTAATLAGAKQLHAQFRYGAVLADWRLPDGDGSVLANLATAIGSYAFVMSGYLARVLPGSVDARQTLMKPVMRSELLLAAVHACIAPRVPRAACRPAIPASAHVAP